MKAALWNDKGTLDVVDKPVPDPKPGWVRLRVASVGICGTDLHFYRGAFPSPVGLQPGHEVGGTIDAASPGVSLATGTAVAVDPLVVCGECVQCRTGNPNRCAKRVLLGVYDFINIIEAPTNEVIARISVELGARGTVQLTTLPAIGIDAFTQMLREGGTK